MNVRELELAGIDAEDMMKRFMNNEKLVRMMLAKFLQDQTYASLCAAIAQGDMKQAEFSCHTLKGVCGNLSLTKLFAITQEQLRLLRAGRFREAAAMMDQISAGYDNAVAHLKLWLEEA